MRTAPLYHKKSPMYSNTATSLSERIGFYALCALLTVAPMHFLVRGSFIYYREAAAAFFSLLLITEILKRSFIDVLRPKELLFMSLFLVFLPIAAFFDPGVNLYAADYMGASEELSKVNPKIYVLRNAFLYIPMLYYFALRGLSRGEVNIIAGIIVLMAPVSVLGYLRHGEVLSPTEILYVVELGGRQLGYNSYIPYLTFPFIASLYLFSITSAKVYKGIFGLIGMFLFFYMLASTSRQSFLFAVIAILSFLFFYRKQMNKMLGLLMIFSTLTVVLFYFYTAGQFYVDSKLITRYASLSGFFDANTRVEIAIHGFSLLTFHEFIWGAGLSSVVVSGPHNDFVRWVQRVGAPMMIIGFMPFFLALRHSIGAFKERGRDSLYLFVALAIGYTIYHSLFGYPRDDAYQAPYVYLGLAIWLGLAKRESTAAVISRYT